ncbi:MAG: phosphopentomutase, partial [Pseudomonadota bacterium]|nr:phosphopentomutase [Pseudomonadota bacterium]
MQKRVIVMVLDSFGIGELPDAADFGDVGCNTLGHIDQYAHANGLEFKIPNMLKLGLGKAFQAVNGKTLFADTNDYAVNGFYGAAREKSSGKDTTSGHWE